MGKTVMVSCMDDGSLLCKAPFYEQIPYDISNLLVLAQADGRGGISRYSLADCPDILVPGSFYIFPSINGVSPGPVDQKKVSMLGRIQSFTLPSRSLKNVIFADDRSPALFSRWTLRNTGAKPVSFRLDFGFRLNGDEMAKFAGGGLDSAGNPHSSLVPLPGAGGLFLEVASGKAPGEGPGEAGTERPGAGLLLSSDSALIIREIQDMGAHLSAVTEIAGGSIPTPAGYKTRSAPWSGGLDRGEPVPAPYVPGACSGRIIWIRPNTSSCSSMPMWVSPVTGNF
ncbi:MAG: hypothetical protein LBQ38_12500 [Spirochaetaceae bacterium]|jgi:hypothetical protein|nr:hypothetical protein [Spirochaetaceae bacterium]